MSLEIAVERVVIDGKRYSNCVLRLDRSTMRIEVLCRVGFISKKIVKMLEIQEKPLDLFKSVKSGKIYSGRASIEIPIPQASSLAEEVKRYISEKSSACLSKHIEILRSLLMERARALKEISEISSRPREKLIEYSKKVGEEAIASGEDAVEKVYLVIKSRLGEKASQILGSPPECPDTPSGIIDKVLKVFSEIIEVQDMIYKGLQENDIVARIEKIWEAMGGLAEDDRKRFLEALGTKDLEKSSEALMSVAQSILMSRISYLVSQEIG